MRIFTRRSAIAHMAVGGAGLLVGRARGYRPVRTQPVRPQPAALIELGNLFRETPGERVFAVAAEAVRRGADLTTFLGAVFWAGIHEIRPGPLGGDLHAIMMVASVFELAEESPPEEAWRAAFWGLDYFKGSQERDRQNGDWVLPSRPTAVPVTAAKAREELLAASRNWDGAAADRAIVGLLPHLERGALFELLWPMAARCYKNIGHKIIFATQIERVLRRLSPQVAEPALRTLITGLLYVGRKAEEEAYERAIALTNELPPTPRKAAEDPTQSLALLTQLRRADWSAAQDLVVAAMKEGLGPQTLWDGLRLYASELYLLRPRAALLRAGPVHSITEVHAFAYAWRCTAQLETKRLLLLQAAAWLGLLKRDFKELYGPPREGPGFDRLASDPQRDNPDFGLLDPGALRTRLDRDRGQREAFLHFMRRQLCRKAERSHQYKYAAAILEESRLTHPNWAACILAPSLTYLPTAQTPDPPLLERTTGALRKAGIL